MRNEVKNTARLYPFADMRQKLKFRVFLITYMFPLYKLMVNVKCHGRDVKENNTVVFLREMMRYAIYI